MKAWGVQAVVGQSFARIFRRNCVNLGPPVPEAARRRRQAAQPGSRIRIDTDTGEVDVDGRDSRRRPSPRLSQELQAAGGLIPFARERP